VSWTSGQRVSFGCRRRKIDINVGRFEDWRFKDHTVSQVFCEFWLLSRVRNSSMSQMMHPSIASAIVADLRLKCCLRREKQFLVMKRLAKLEVELKSGGFSDSMVFLQMGRKHALLEIFGCEESMRGNEFTRDVVAKTALFAPQFVSRGVREGFSSNFKSYRRSVATRMLYDRDNALRLSAGHSINLGRTGNTL
jgi:hypothetical protein